MAYAIKGPATAIENAFAPRVVKPPWASNKDWNSNTIVPITLITNGPNKIVPRPTPVGWEQLPVTDGIFNADNTKVKAPDNPSNNFVSEFSLIKLLIFFRPIIKNGMVTNHQKIAQPIGKNPSITCIANTGLGTINKTARK